MLEEARSRTAVLQSRMKELGIAQAVFTDESSIAYLAGFWGCLGIEFGRPTMLAVCADDDPVVITLRMESEMVGEMTRVTDIRVWEDIGQHSWGRVLCRVLGDAPAEIGIEKPHVPAIVRNFLDDSFPGVALRDISPVLGAQRTIKSPLEIEVMRQAGQIAGAMMTAAHESLAVGGREYESALAESAAGFLTDRGWERCVSPMIRNLQILQSGADTSMVHRRASVREYRRADPVYFCFCNMAQFKQYKLGFDRMFHIAEDIAAAANGVYAERGYETGYRTGRSIGVAYLEAPELKAGDKTVLQSGMTFAVDGGISIDGVTAGRIGDSVVVTRDGCDYLTRYPRELLVTAG